MAPVDSNRSMTKTGSDLVEQMTTVRTFKQRASGRGRATNIFQIVKLITVDNVL
jgi:hypothetical protein